MRTKSIQQYKKDAVSRLKGSLCEANGYVLIDYRGLSMKRLTALRRVVRAQGASLRVVKNNYLEIVLKELQMPYDESILVGPTAIAVMGEDSVAGVKALVEFEGGAPLVLKGGFLEQTVFDPKELLAFSKLPGKNELIAQLLGTLQAPIQSTAGALSASVCQLLYALNAVKDKQS